ncbi:hypothetical protein EJ998_25295 [Burkholderia cepacia ATCC 25416]|nr:hypothetical protein EJ998_25295 [Burkholderia cepacia ATCC 25416]
MPPASSRLPASRVPLQRRPNPSSAIFRARHVRRPGSPSRHARRHDTGSSRASRHVGRPVNARTCPASAAGPTESPELALPPETSAH